jgi:hypothetical protein
MQTNFPKAMQKWFALCLAGLLWQQNTQAQAISETFNNVSALFSAGWAQQNNSTAPVGNTWFQGNTTVFTAFSSPDSSYIGANFNATANTGATGATISQWLFTPNRTFNNGDVIRFYSRSAGTFADRLEVRLSAAGTSTNVGTTATSVGDYTTNLLTINAALTANGYPTTWTQYTITISGLAGPTSGRIGFRYFVTDGGPNGNNSNYIGIDNFEYIPVGGPAINDLRTVSHTGEYTLIPRSQRSNMSMTATVNNAGTSTASTASLTTRVFSSSNNFATPVFTATSGTVSLAPGASSALTSGTYFPPDTGTYVFQHICSGGGSFSDINRANDTLVYVFGVTDSSYARDNGDFSGGNSLGLFTPTSRLEFGQIFQVTNNATLSSITAVALLANVNDTIRYVVRNVSGGLPTTLVGASAPYRLQAADVSGAVVTLPVGLNLTPGTYYAAIEKYFTTDTVALFVTTSIFTANTGYFSVNGGAYTATTQAQGVPAIRMNLRQSCAVTASATSTAAVCTNNGTATATPASGATPYTYTWSNTRTTQTITGLAAGTYTVTVRDNAGCVVTATTIVSATTSTINATANSTNVGCTVNGSVSLSGVSGGTAPYSYLWSNASTAQNLSNVAANTYTVTISDANGCTTTRSATVSNSAITINGSATTTNTACGANTGSATASASNGTAPFTFLWSNGAAGATANALSAGSYTVTITDANGCQGVVSNVVVANSNGPSASTTANNPTCATGNNGSIVLNISGGTTPYNILWSNNQTTSTATGLGAGTYTATITDANNCQFTVNSSLTAPAAIAVNGTTNNPTCATSTNGSINVTATGGTGTLSFNWSSGQNTANASGLGAGSFTVSVIDGNGCVQTANFSLTAPSSVNLGTPTVVNAACNGINNGSIFLNSLSGGTAPYGFSWSTGATTQSITGIGAGGYFVTVTDANGCTSVNSSAIMVSAGASPSVAINKTDVTVAGANNGTASATVTGGNSPFTYLWSNSATTASISGLAPGSYTLTVTDANGCQGTGTVNINNGPVSIQQIAGGSLAIFPNPTTGLFNVQLELNNSQDVSLRLVNVTGQVVKTIEAGTLSQGQWQFNLSEMPAGVYFLHIQTGVEKTTQRIVLSK